MWKLAQLLSVSKCSRYLTIQIDLGARQRLIPSPEGGFVLNYTVEGVYWPAGRGRIRRGSNSRLEPETKSRSLELI